MKRAKMRFSILCMAVGVVLLTSCKDSYEKLLAKQGYMMMAHPRGEFGTGTIYKELAANRQLFVAAPEECFPGLTSAIHPDAIKLVDSKQQSNLSVDIGGKYLPTAPATIAASFGATRLKKLDVSFGETTANDITVEGLAKYFDSKKVTKRCFDYLSSDKTNLIVSAVQVKSMNYVFHWESGTTGKVDADALKSTLKATGVVSYTTTGDNSLTISQPMYVAYTAYRFKDLGVPRPPEEAAAGDVTLGKVKIEQERNVVLPH